MTEATCYMCGDTYTTRGIPRHLPSCKESSEPTVREESAHISIRPPRGSTYRLELSVTSEASLGDLDRFLRAIWVECCDHLSSFRINRTELNKDRSVTSLSTLRSEITYDYDFGSTTALTVELRDIDDATFGVAAPVNEEIHVMARNDPPEYACVECGNPATTGCAEHMYGENPRGWLCEECKVDHPCDPWAYFPIVNSPRMGVCGFAGARLTDWVPDV